MFFCKTQVCLSHSAGANGLSRSAGANAKTGAAPWDGTRFLFSPLEIVVFLILLILFVLLILLILLVLLVLLILVEHTGKPPSVSF